MERNKIRVAAVRQAERLAGQYDLSGKLFNVGEVKIMPDGQVKSVEGLQRAADAKARREAEKKENEERKKTADETKKALKEGKLPPSITETPGINPQRLGLVQGLETVANATNGPRISNKQKLKQELLNPRVIPPKPIIPEGYSLPEGEENYVALWDITDEEIKKRLAMAKAKAANERKALRKKQKEEKKFNRAMKVLRKQAANKGVVFNPEEAKRTILGENSDTASLKDSDSSSASCSDSDSDSDSDSASDNENEVSVKKFNKANKSTSSSGKAPITSSDSNSMKRKRSTDDVDEEPEAKKAKSKNGDPSVSAKEREKARKQKLREALDPEFLEKRLKKEKQKVVNEQKRIDKLAAKQAGELYTSKKPAKMRKRAREPEEPKGASKIVDAEALPVEAAEIVEPESKKRKKSKSVEEEVAPAKAAHEVEPEKKKYKKKKNAAIEQSASAVEVVQEKKKHKKQNFEVIEAATNQAVVGENWNIEALTGDEARKQKYLRLLGAGKSAGESTKTQKSSKKDTDITKVQTDLELQYESSMKKKHDGGSKRRGLGA